MDTAQITLAAQLNSAAEYSKKYQMTVKGMQAVLAIFLAGAVAYIIQPVALGPLLDYGKAAITAIGGMVAVYLGGQAWVDRQTTIGLSK